MENNTNSLEYNPIHNTSMESNRDMNNAYLPESKSPNQGSYGSNTKYESSNNEEDGTPNADGGNDNGGNDVSNEGNDNMIGLLDGSVIEGYPIKDAPGAEHWKGMRLDSTGEYFIISGKKPKQMNPREAEAVETEKFFLEHAFFFLANAKRILSDSRMFLAPVPVRSGIAYTGTSGFTAPTLGVYIEWWLNTPVSMVEKNGRRYLTWHIAGSPLSGRNHCSIVDGRGKSSIHSFCGFSKLWNSFVKINTRYQPYKGRFEAYTLEQVYRLLGGDDPSNNTVDKRKNRSLLVECFFLRSQCESLAMELSKKGNQNEALRHQLTRTRIECNKEELSKVYEQYLRRKAEIDVRQEDLRVQRMGFRKRMRAGEITPQEFQRLVRPINKELNGIRYGGFDEFDNLYSQYQVNLADIIDYFEPIVNHQKDKGSI